jgi:hypothetical protein
LKAYNESTIQTEIITEGINVLIDLPFFVAGLLVIILCPWRWKSIGNDWKIKKDLNDRRLLCARQLGYGLLDWAAIVLLMPLLVTVYRIKNVTFKGDQQTTSYERRKSVFKQVALLLLDSIQ